MTLSLLLFQLALTDLRVNTKISPLLPFFINFVSNGVCNGSYAYVMYARYIKNCYNNILIGPLSRVSVFIVVSWKSICVRIGIQDCLLVSLSAVHLV